MTRDEYIIHIRDQCNSYERTIQSIIAFDAVVRCNSSGQYLSSSYFLPGRKFLFADNHVTPDVAIQLTKHYGIVGEVKITASTEQDFDKTYKQIQKYDNDLVGWLTENKKVLNHDLALMVDDLKKTYAKRYFEEKNFQRKFAIIAYALQEERQQYCKIERYFGAFSEPSLERKLDNPVAVPLEKIVDKISNIKFYDAQPPLEYTMNVLWFNVFNELLQRGVNTTVRIIETDCDEITNILNEKFTFKQFDQNQPKVPRQGWIQEALDAFVKIKYAIKDSGDKYRIKYSSSRKTSLLEVFAGKVFDEKNKNVQKNTDDQQVNLF